MPNNRPTPIPRDERFNGSAWVSRERLAEISERWDAFIAHDIEIKDAGYPTTLDAFWYALQLTPQPTDPREFAHMECDCVPDLGQSHCHKCGDEAGGRIIAWKDTYHGERVQRTGDVAELIAEQLPEGTRMHAYYYGFDRTGLAAIDLILSAVATAGKGYHHTEQWADEEGDTTPSHEARIQAAAGEAANRIVAALTALSSELASTRQQLADAEAVIAQAHACWYNTRFVDDAGADMYVILDGYKPTTVGTTDEATAQTADLARQSAFYTENPRVDAEPEQEDLR